MEENNCLYGGKQLGFFKQEDKRKTGHCFNVE
jgi:hypothetical protein